MNFFFCLTLFLLLFSIEHNSITHCFNQKYLFIRNYQKRFARKISPYAYALIAESRSKHKIGELKAGMGVYPEL